MVVQMLDGGLDRIAPTRFLTVKRTDLEEKIDKEAMIEVS